MDEITLSIVIKSFIYSAIIMGIYKLTRYCMKSWREIR